MPKVLVVFDSADDRADHFAEIATDGARSVRFTEVDARVVGKDSSTNTRRRQLESPDAVEQYDGVVVIASDRQIPLAIDALLTDLERASASGFVDRVYASIEEDGAISARLSALGGIVVGLRAGSVDAEMRARKLGERVAKVAEWVRHALSHEHGHGDSHHAHSHSHHSH